MNDKPEEFDASMPLPNESKDSSSSDSDKENSKPAKAEDPAADLIRKKVDAAYGHEPDAAAEVSQVAKSPGTKLSKHQKFIAELTASGKSVADTQTAWHEYYAGLSDTEKHQVWQEFYVMQSQTARHPAIAAAPKHTLQTRHPKKKPLRTITRHLTHHKDRALGAIKKKPAAKAASPLRSLLFGLSAGAIVVIVVLFGFFNERFIAPFIQPSRSVSNIPLISGSAVGPNPEVIIPKINVQVPVVYGVNSIKESIVQEALHNGVVHYADTALPGQNGNIVIVGHSSNNIFNSGKYKFAFVLLNRLDTDDTFYLHKDGKRYTYRIYEKKIVQPNDVSVLEPTKKSATATLITCDPPGTSRNRLVVVGEQISPDPSKNKPQATSNALAAQTKIVPGNPQSLWSRLTHWLSQ